MSRPVFYKLCSRLRDRGLLLDTFHVSVEEQVAVVYKCDSIAQQMWNDRLNNNITVENYMVKKNKVGSADVEYREKYKTWTDDSTEFMLQWALKEKWNWIRQALAKSGNGFDAASRKFNLPYSEKSPSKLGTLKYNYLTRPIKFFQLMEELFGESGQANGSLAIDQYTSDAEDDRSEIETDDSFTVEHGENDSDTIARSDSPDLAFSSGLKHKNMKSPMKKLRKHKEKRANALENDKIASSIVMLANSVASSAPAPADPYANLWKRIEDIP
ncbi:hypothetical protein C2845_PM06G15450 [Panicum miliaceum]|uniref:Myb/SANT-like domain-containing protein n=1 Tax=Panicum miliaceum TaxID=4540 RepID=A0A3L6R9N7_PANMI|nr:hypothetical protein C2845_PM06G15450 [Panicum miliaceum]